MSVRKETNNISIVKGNKMTSQKIDLSSGLRLFLNRDGSKQSAAAKQYETYLFTLIEKAVRKHPEISEKALDQITNQDVINLLASVKFKNSTFRQSERALRQWQYFISKAFAWFYKNHFIAKLPMQKLNHFNQSFQGKESSVSMDEITSLFNYEPTTDLEFRDKIIIQLLAETGARVSEICSFRIEDFKEETIRGQKLQFLVMSSSKVNKPRKIILSNTIGMAVKTYIQKIRPNIPSGSDGLFLTREGQEIEPRFLQKRIELLCKKITHRHITLASLRRASAVNKHEHGIPVNENARFLGHTSNNTTWKYITDSLNQKYGDDQQNEFSTILL